MDFKWEFNFEATEKLTESTTQYGAAEKAVCLCMYSSKKCEFLREFEQTKQLETVVTLLWRWTTNHVRGAMTEGTL